MKPSKEIELHPEAALRARRWRGCKNTAAASGDEKKNKPSKAKKQKPA
jgi:hypothetical protein